MTVCRAQRPAGSARTLPPRLAAEGWEEAAGESARGQAVPSASPSPCRKARRRRFSRRSSSTSTPRSAPCWPPAPGAARSISTCRNARWCWTTPARSSSVAPRPRLDSHRLIEEFMILANVAAAEELERPPSRPACTASTRRRPTRSWRRCAAFSPLSGISLPPGNQIHPRDLDRVLRRVADTPEAPLVNEVMLRSQSQAAYSPDNIGHFGLALTRYAHFTSPIRRYADLLVHRALIASAAPGSRRAGQGGGRALPGHRRPHRRHRAPGRSGGARCGGPLPCCIHGG